MSGDYNQDTRFVLDEIGNLTARSAQTGWGTSETIQEFHYFDNLSRLLF